VLAWRLLTNFAQRRGWTGVEIGCSPAQWRQRAPSYTHLTTAIQNQHTSPPPLWSLNRKTWHGKPF
jgi:hypothetical protein